MEQTKLLWLCTQSCLARAAYSPGLLHGDFIIKCDAAPLLSLLSHYLVGIPGGVVGIDLTHRAWSWSTRRAVSKWLEIAAI